MNEIMLVVAVVALLVMEMLCWFVSQNINNIIFIPFYSSLRFRLAYKLVQSCTTEISTHLPSTAPQHWHAYYNPTKAKEVVLCSCSKCSGSIVTFRRWRKHHINVGFIWISTKNEESIVSIYISLNGYEVHSKRAIENDSITYVPVAFSIRIPPWNSEYIPVACTIASLTTVIVPFNKKNVLVGILNKAPTDCPISKSCSSMNESSGNQNE